MNRKVKIDSREYIQLIYKKNIIYNNNHLMHVWECSSHKQLTSHHVVFIIQIDINQGVRTLDRIYINKSSKKLPFANFTKHTIYSVSKRQENVGK